MTLLQMLYFSKICEYRNFSRASESLYVSQPTLSVAIKAIEDEYKTKLIIRNKNTLSLTQEGEFLLKEVNEILAIYDKINSSMAKFNQAKKIITIGFPPILSYCLGKLFPALEEDFEKEHPDYTLVFKESTSKYSSVDMLLNNEIDVLFASSMRLANSNLHSEKVFNLPLKLFVGPDNKLKNQKIVDFSDFSDERIMIAYPEGTEIYKMVASYCLVNNYRLDHRFNITQISILKEMIRKNRAVSLSFDDGSLYSDDIFCVSLNNAASLDICIGWDTNKPLMSGVADLIEYVCHYNHGLAAHRPG